MASPIRIAWPGFSVRSRLWPLRLLRKPITATRWAIGVLPGTSTADPVSMVTTSSDLAFSP